MKTSGLRIFVDFFSPMPEALVGTVGAGIDKRKIAVTPVEVSARGNGSAAAAALVGGLTCSGNGAGM